MTRSLARSLVASLALLSACNNPAPVTDSDAGSDAGPTDTGPVGRDVGTDAAAPYPSYCENVSGVHCLLPFPSSRFLEADATTRTGRRVAFPIEAMPRNARDTPLDPAGYNRFDGFSPATSLVTAFEGGDIDPANLVDERHIGDSVLDTSPTLLFEVHGTTLTRVHHFAEIDQFQYADPDRRPLFLRPAARLTPETRYIVAIRNLRHPGGTPIAPSAYFQALRDDMPLSEASDLEARRPAFEDVFDLLTAAGVQRGELQQAWDFWTASDESITTDMITVRDRGLAALMADGTSCTVTQTMDDVDTHVFRRIYGTVRVPLFIGGTDATVDEQCMLVRDAEGLPTRNTTTPSVDVPFIISIPRSVQTSLMAGGQAGRLLEYGHGLLGSRDESESGWLGEFADESQLVVVAVDWWGLSGEDIPRATGSIGNLSRLPATTERLAQGLFNFLAIVRSLIVDGQCQQLPELQINGHLAFDPDERYYHGNSQGGIMGTTLAGISTDITRFGIGVGGMAYSLMIPRSVDGELYVGLMYNNYRHDALVASVNWVMSQAQWDVTDPSSFASHVRSSPLPCALPECTGGLTPIHHVAYQIGRDDAQVPNASAAFAARSMLDASGEMLPLMSDATHTSPFVPFGLPTTSGPVESALTVFLIPNTPELPIGAVIPDGDTPAHEGVRRSQAAQTQLDHFFHADGVVEQTCDGPCDPD
ncbi:MAG: hypothetical protein U0234_06590 [Sandaracinus sp.]